MVDITEPVSYAWIIILVVLVLLIVAAGSYAIYRKKKYGYFFKATIY